MTMDGEGAWFPFPSEEPHRQKATGALQERLDSLLPVDSETGAADFESLRTYLGAFMDMMARHAQPLTLMMIAPDPNETTKVLGHQGTALIRAAIARCLRQETRIHDVVGRAPSDGEHDAPAFLLVLPLMAEASATKFAQRLIEEMSVAACAEGRPWLTLSVGLASLTLESETPDTLVARARLALANAQRTGGDRISNHTGAERRRFDRDHLGPLHE